MIMKKKIKNKKIKIKDMIINLIREKDYPEYINIYYNDSYNTQGLIIWNKEDAFKLAYKLMSLASEMR